MRESEKMDEKIRAFAGKQRLALPPSYERRVSAKLAEQGGKAKRRGKSWKVAYAVCALALVLFVTANESVLAEKIKAVYEFFQGTNDVESLYTAFQGDVADGETVQRYSQNIAADIMVDGDSFHIENIAYDKHVVLLPVIYVGEKTSFEELGYEFIMDWAPDSYSHIRFFDPETQPEGGLAAYYLLTATESEIQPGEKIYLKRACDFRAAEGETVAEITLTEPVETLELTREDSKELGESEALSGVSVSGISIFAEGWGETCELVSLLRRDGSEVEILPYGAFNGCKEDAGSFTLSYPFAAMEELGELDTAVFRVDGEEITVPLREHAE